jgi:hypothetical protein
MSFILVTDPSMPLPFVNHREEILHEVIGRPELGADLAKSSQSFLFHLIQALGVTDKEPDGSIGSLFQNALRIG